ncbi:MAG: SMP-30/gluconolactonase/LRE family protein [Flavobacteriales bacterium]|nr:SMP-30/gluconolactonase/LRE family protein [Flavobacteriales bacterium]
MRGVLILNEGNFGLGNSTLTLIDSTGKVTKDAFRKKNGNNLGDVGQSILVVEDTAFVVINSSNKVYKLLLPDLELLKQSQLAGSPRYMIKWKANRYLISDIGADRIMVVDGNLNEIVSVDSPGWNEEMWVDSKYVFACNVKDNRVAVFNTSDLSFVKYISVGTQPQSIVQDAHGKIWVLCDGGFDKNKQKLATLHRIDVSNLTTDYLYQFQEISMSPSRLRISSNGQFLYFLNSSVFAFKVDLSEPEPKEIISMNGVNFYGLGISIDGQIWASDANDFSKDGRVLVFSPEGKFEYEFSAGHIPQHIAFF